MDPESGRSVPGQAVWSTAILGWKRLDQTAPLKARERSVERPWAELYTGELLNVDGDGVTVLRSPGEAGEDEQARVIESLPDRSHNVILAQPGAQESGGGCLAGSEHLHELGCVRTRIMRGGPRVQFAGA